MKGVNDTRDDAKCPDVYKTDVFIAFRLVCLKSQRLLMEATGCSSSFLYSSNDLPMNWTSSNVNIAISLMFTQGLQQKLSFEGAMASWQILSFRIILDALRFVCPPAAAEDKFAVHSIGILVIWPEFQNSFYCNLSVACKWDLNMIQ
ncbi:hypothetical protein HNY73_001531 [Argiope bruennichi]|uniref:Uncharacterized protein n=1 Tax=Argiope bruennichi TaxID=94029 RepID=A0A8T0G2T3_ARGBR|nr:hypothetical protein HNY73_001531 [Argiope bruennichi]